MAECGSSVIIRSRCTELSTFSVFKDVDMPQLNRLATGVMFLLCVGAVTGCGNSALPPQSEWTTVTSEDGRMSALFPRPPKYQNQSVDSALGKLDIKITMYESGSNAFLISHMTYPVDPSEYDVQAGLAGASQGAAQNVKGTILEDNDIVASGFPGKSILISTPEGAFVRGRIFIEPAGPTLFQAQVVGTRAAIDGPNTSAFLDSVTLK